jgi:hypothetical protein
MPSNGNLAFAENLIDQLTGDSNLIAVGAGLRGSGPSRW